MSNEQEARKKLLANQLAGKPEPVALADFDAGVTLNADGSAHVRFLDLRGMRAALEAFEKGREKGSEAKLLEAQQYIERTRSHEAELTKVVSEQRDNLVKRAENAERLESVMKAERDALNLLCNATADLHVKATETALEAVTRAASAEAGRDELRAQLSMATENGNAAMKRWEETAAQLTAVEEDRTEARDMLSRISQAVAKTRDESVDEAVGRVVAQVAAAIEQARLATNVCRCARSNVP